MYSNRFLLTSASMLTERGTVDRWRIKILQFVWVKIPPPLLLGWSATLLYIYIYILYYNDNDALIKIKYLVMMNNDLAFQQLVMKFKVALRETIVHIACRTFELTRNLCKYICFTSSFHIVHILIYTYINTYKCTYMGSRYVTYITPSIIINKVK